MTPEIKKDWLARAKIHQEADRFIKGQWLNGMVGDYKSGCFFGCMTQSDNNTLELAASQMSSPEWIVRLAERIFEGLPQGESELFPVQYMEAIPSNLNDDEYEEIRHRLGVIRMRRLVELVSQIETEESYKQECLDSIGLVIDYQLNPSRSAARSAAESAARSAARSAAWSAAESAAESAAWSAARSAAYIQERDDLFSVFKEYK